MKCYASLIVVSLLLLLKAKGYTDNADCTIDGSCSNPNAVSDTIDLANIELPDPELPKGSNEYGTPHEISRDCLDRHEQCIDFQAQGECDQNPGWMIINCAKSCNACELRDPKLRCNRERLGIAGPSYMPGDMESMFGSIESRFQGIYNITVLSKDPWVVILDGFLADDESKALITTVDKWERSTDTGSSNEFGEAGRVVSQGRTSSNAWCREQCENDPRVQNVMGKIEEVTRIPRENYESFQILRYELGQKYVVHHDSSADDNELACGPRILTFFLYMSDVEEGGETNFPTLGIDVKPKKGRALLWPSTMDSDPTEMDQRTFHEAKPVIKGRKFAANAWIHLYNFMEPNKWGCTGSFDEL